MDNLHELQLKALELIKNHKNNDFIILFESNIEQIKKIDLPNLYRKSCEKGNVVIVDFLLNCPLNNLIDYDFPYAEGNMYDEEIPNGALFLAFDDKHLDLVEYFVRNDIYYIDSKTENALERYMSSALDELRKIESKLYLEESLSEKSTKKKNIKI